MLSFAKKLSISLGLYRPARALHRTLNRAENEAFTSHKKLLAEFIKHGDLAFDIGANIGSRTAIMLALGAKVVAFEPQPACAMEVRARGGNRLVVFRKAVGAAIGSADLRLNSITALSSFVPDWGGEGHGILTVEVTTLDTEIGKFGIPSFCKIDVEGFEVEVLQGLSSPVPALSFEFQTDRPQKMRDCLGRLQEIGNYRINLIGGETAKWLLEDWLPISEFLGIFPECARSHPYGDIFARLDT